MTETYNIQVNQGDSYKLRATINIQLPDFCVGSACMVVPVDFDNKTVVAQIKQTADSCASADFTITYPGEPGVVDLFLPASESETLQVGTNYYWDLRVIDDSSNETFTAFKGTVSVSQTISG